MPKSTLVVGLGDIKVSKNPNDIIKAYALGSCIGIVAIATRMRVMGLAHVVLPNSKTDPDKARLKPGYFANTAVPALLKEFERRGLRSPRELMIKLVGGASIMDQNRTFDIGKRNLLAVRKELWKNKLVPVAENVGLDFSRTVVATVDTLGVSVVSPGREVSEL